MKKAQAGFYTAIFIVIILIILIGIVIYSSYTTNTEAELAKERALFQQVEQLGVRQSTLTTDMMKDLLLTKLNITVDELNKHLDNYKKLASADYDLGLISSISGKYPDALALYNAELAKKPNQEDVLLSKGDVLFLSGEYNQSLNTFQNIISINPMNANALYGISTILYRIENYSGVVEYSDKILVVPSNITYTSPKAFPDILQVLIMKADALYKLGRYNESVIAYDKALSVDANNTALWFNKGVAAGTIGEFNISLQAFDNVIQIQPNNVNAWYNKGYTLVNLKNYTEAVDAFNHSLQLNPNSLEALNNMANALGMTGRFDEALVEYDKIIKLDENNTKAWFNKGLTLTNLSRYTEAKDAFKHVCDIDPKFDEKLNCKALT